MLDPSPPMGTFNIARSNQVSMTLPIGNNRSVNAMAERQWQSPGNSLLAFQFEFNRVPKRKIIIAKHLPPFLRGAIKFYSIFFKSAVAHGCPSTRQVFLIGRPTTYVTGLASTFTNKNFQIGCGPIYMPVFSQSLLF